MRSTSYDFLLSLPRYDKRGAASLKPGFDRIEKLLALMGNPHRAYRIAHVAGTNGKGSTCSMLAAVCTRAGLRTGLQTSPHLFDITERMRIDGVPAETRWFEKAIHQFRRPMEKIGPSFFEATTALSFLYFAEQNVDVAVVEVGLGGRLDATNIVEPCVCGISTIGIDHVAILGSDLRSIAAEKAGIIKAGVPVFTSNDKPEVLEVIRAAAAQRGAPFETTADYFTTATGQDDSGKIKLTLASTRHNYGTIELDLRGQHQVGNAMLAVAMAESLLPASERSFIGAISDGLAKTRSLAGLRGRLDIISTNPLIVADVGHNLDGVETALRFARSRCKGRLHVGIGLLRDKDYRGIVRLVSQIADVAHVIPLSGDRALDPRQLESELEETSVLVERGGTAAEILSTFRRRAKPEEGLLFVGSHQVVAQLDRKLLG